MPNLFQIKPTPKNDKRTKDYVIIVLMGAVISLMISLPGGFIWPMLGIIAFGGIAGGTFVTMHQLHPEREIPAYDFNLLVLSCGLTLLMFLAHCSLQFAYLVDAL